MASKKNQEFYSRRQRGYELVRYGPGFDRWGYPIICGVVDSDGNECGQRAVVYGMCWTCSDKRDRELDLNDKPTAGESS